MNKKGLVITSILYPMMVSVIGVSTLFVSVGKANKMMDPMKLNVNNSIFDSVTCDCEMINSTLKKYGERIVTIDNTINNVKKELENIKKVGNAKAGDILSGKTALVQGKLVTGTMADRGTAQYGEGWGWVGSGDNEYFAINRLPEGYYHAEGNWWAPEARIKASTVRNELGITADKIIKGQSIAGVAGTAETGTNTDDANAGAGDILSGKTAYVKGNKVTGSMTNQGAYTSTVSIGYDGGLAYFRIPAGAYLTPTVMGYPEIMANLSDIGISADKILKGQIIAGIDGTATSDATATASDIEKGKTAYVNGKKIEGTREDNADHLLKTEVANEGDIKARIVTTYMNPKKDTVFKDDYWTTWQTLSSAGGNYDANAEKDSSWWKDTYWDIPIDYDSFYKARKIVLTLANYDGTEASLGKSGESDFYTSVKAGKGDCSKNEDGNCTSSDNYWGVLPQVTIEKTANSTTINRVMSDIDFNSYQSSLSCSNGTINDKSTYYNTSFFANYDSRNKQIVLQYSSNREISSLTTSGGCTRKKIGKESDDFWNSDKAKEYCEYNSDAAGIYIYYWKCGNDKSKENSKGSYAAGRLTLRARYNHWSVSLRYYD